MELKLDFKTLGMGNLTKSVEKMTELNDKFDGMQNKLKENKKAFDGLADFKIVRFFDSINTKMLDISKQSKIMESVGGSFGLAAVKLEELEALLISIGVYEMSDISLFKKLGKSIIWAGKQLVTYALPLAAIAGAVFVLGRIWKENIGGIQSLWIKFSGHLSNSFARFDVELRKFLHEFGPVLSVVFKASFELMIGLVEGITASLKVLVFVFKPLLRILNSFMSIFLKDGQKSIGVWKAIGQALGIVLTAMIGLSVISKIVSAVQMLSGAFAILNAIIIANPILAILAGAILIIVILQKKFNIIGKTVELLTKAFNMFKDIIVKLFMLSVENMPFFRGIKLVSKAVSMLKQKSSATADESSSSRASNTVGQLSSVNNNATDNRSATVTIHTTNLDKRTAKGIANNFIDPVLGANKQM